mgnify:CR=1 FL=1
MNQITDIVISGSMSILVVLVGIVVNSVKQYLLTRGGKKALETAEILAKNAVQATEQVADKLDIHGADKLEHAKTSLIEGLEAYNIYLTNDQLNQFSQKALSVAREYDYQVIKQQWLDFLRTVKRSKKCDKIIKVMIFARLSKK